MKFNALVVAAMVITSVNAAGKGGLWSCFGLGCRSKSRMARDSQAYGQKSGMSQIPSDNELGPGLSQGPSRERVEKAVRDIESKSTQDPQKYGSKVVVPGGPSEDRVEKAVRNLESKTTHDSQKYGSKVVMPGGQSEDRVGEAVRNLESKITQSLSEDNSKSEWSQGPPGNELGKSKRI
ncbi:hypothetical protein BASA61_002231 [Batrachochytrium salamandrivorans]|nr:hypothetical protein BASA61_002231 [Batrachochytrium salamandrivorans]KAH9266752.1 hypothetical protein BASA84_001004 [Batrachochytrium salamandrivorans]